MVPESHRLYLLTAAGSPSPFKLPVITALWWGLPLPWQVTLLGQAWEGCEMSPEVAQTDVPPATGSHLESGRTRPTLPGSPVNILCHFLVPFFRNNAAWDCGETREAAAEAGSSGLTVPALVPPRFHLGLHPFRGIAVTIVCAVTEPCLSMGVGNGECGNHLVT